jgi:hypothetical protein
VKKTILKNVLGDYIAVAIAMLILSMSFIILASITQGAITPPTHMIKIIAIMQAMAAIFGVPIIMLFSGYFFQTKSTVVGSQCPWPQVVSIPGPAVMTTTNQKSTPLGGYFDRGYLHEKAKRKAQLDPFEWVFLEDCSYYAKGCNWDKVGGIVFYNIMEAHPKYALYCDWDDIAFNKKQPYTMSGYFSKMREIVNCEN